MVDKKQGSGFGKKNSKVAVARNGLDGGDGCTTTQEKLKKFKQRYLFDGPIHKQYSSVLFPCCPVPEDLEGDE